MKREMKIWGKESHEPHDCRDQLYYQLPKHLDGNEKSVEDYSTYHKWKVIRITRSSLLQIENNRSNGKFVNLQLKIHLANYLTIEMNWPRWHHRPVHNNQLHDKTQRLNFENVLVQLYPKSRENNTNIPFHLIRLTCIVTSRSSICTSLVKKSAPMVALYWLENLCETNCPIKLVFPTPLSPTQSIQSMNISIQCTISYPE